MAGCEKLIVIVPGIGGSVLADADGVVWGDSRRRIARRVLDPGRLAVPDALEPLRLMDTRGFIPPLRLNAYTSLHRHALSLAERYGRVDVLAVPYDFRLGVRVAADRLEARVNDRLTELSDEERAGRVVVLAHSMGGLVARHWLARPRQARLCSELITLGTPFRGAPKVLDWLVNGAAAGPWVTESTTRLLAHNTGFTDVIRGWQGMYDLVPTYEVIRTATGTTASPAELTTLLAGLPNAAPFTRTTTFRHLLDEGRSTHHEIAEGWADLEHPPTLTPYYSRHHSTPHLIQLFDNGRLRVKATDPCWQTPTGWAGDGTVPAIAATPPELDHDPDRWRYVGETHGKLPSSAAVAARLDATFGEARRVRGDDPAQAHLALGLPEAGLHGESMTLRARVVAADPGEDVRLIVTPQPEAGPALPEVVLDPPSGDDEWYAAEWRPPSPGLWTLRVDAVVGSSPRLHLDDTVAVLPQDEDD